MSVGANQGRTGQSRPVSRAGGRRARSLIEALEARQLLSFQSSFEISHLHTYSAAANAFPAAQMAMTAHADVDSAAMLPVIAGQVLFVSHSGDGQLSTTTAGNPVVCTTGANSAANSATTTCTAIASNGAVAGATAMVTRLTSGSDFSGYQYISANGSAPPLINVADPGNTENFEFPPGSTVSSTAPRKFKPSDRVGSTAPSGPSVTPLAQTPTAMPASAFLSGRSSGTSVPSPVTVPPPAATSGTSLPSALPHAPIYLAPLAMIHTSEVVVAAASVTAVKAVDGLAYASNKAADALSLMASPEGLADVASYNFVHFNPSVLLNDAIAAFSQESASLSFVPVPTHSTARAWTITAAVVGFDLLLMGYCYHKSRRQKAIAAVALAATGSTSD